MKCKYYNPDGVNNPNRYETRDMRVYLIRSRRPDRAYTDGMGPILRYGKHFLVLFVGVDGQLSVEHVKDTH